MSVYLTYPICCMRSFEICIPQCKPILLISAAGCHGWPIFDMVAFDNMYVAQALFYSLIYYDSLLLLCIFHTYTIHFLCSPTQPSDCPLLGDWLWGRTFLFWPLRVVSCTLYMSPCDTFLGFCLCVSSSTPEPVKHLLLISNKCVHITSIHLIFCIFTFLVKSNANISDYWEWSIWEWFDRTVTWCFGLRCPILIISVGISIYHILHTFYVFFLLSPNFYPRYM